MNAHLDIRAAAGGIPSAWRQWLAHIAAVERDFWHTAKTRTVQFMAGSASLIWGVSVIFERETGFTRRGFTMMREQAPAAVWAAIFLAHALMVMVSRWSPIEMPRFRWFVSFYGFCIWTYYVIATCISAERFVISTSFEIVGVIMLAWALRRAGGDLVQHGGRDADAG